MLNDFIFRFRNRFIVLFPILVLLSSCTPKANLTHYQQNRYYKTSRGDTTIFFTINQLDEKRVSGVYYMATDLPTTQAVSFRTSLRRVSRKTPFLVDSCTLYNYPSIPKTYPNRYKESLYQVQTIKNIPFASVKGHWDSYVTDDESYLSILAKGLTSTLSSKDLELKMDLYIPQSNDSYKRPLLVCIHGGAFYIGDKENPAIVAFCKQFASLGYTTASINYRLGYTLNKSSIERTGYQAIQDAHAAIRFLVNKQNEYQIDTSTIFVCGTSAGAITALNLAYMTNANRPESSRKSFFNDELGDIETSGNNLKERFTIKGVGNMWGAINDINHLKTAPIPVISFHGDQDRIVPYGYDYPFEVVSKKLGKIIFGKMYGSYEIHKMLKQLKTREKLVTFKNSDHEPHVDEKGMPNKNHDYITKEMRDFFYDELIPEEIEIFRNYNNLQIFAISGRSIGEIEWGIIGGFIISTQDQSAKIVFIEDEKNKFITVSGCYKNGAPFYKSFKIND
ncbi:MAG TPA: alpha/beta hydrolase [Bacteroidales bacterium]|nr:alpha/beta hydrolase [Bacteroidales bacterium]HOH21733.1 alpha/beta hydrolase [Bacteroidales bacterium]HPB57589.1 alpha/beta hydrolase [Bacteroidales bacterium]HPZ02872.1 alpha/beta hydrolase [Bacteroidales bacterium]HQB74246.1 alpha/beta hydrolase [Bacteroidales bacterium]